MMDAYANKRVTSGAVLVASAYDTNEQISVSVVNNLDGTFTGSYTSYVAGYFFMSVVNSANNAKISNSPFHIYVLPGNNNNNFL